MLIGFIGITVKIVQLSVPPVLSCLLPLTGLNRLSCCLVPGFNKITAAAGRKINDALERKSYLAVAGIIHRPGHSNLLRT